MGECDFTPSDKPSMFRSEHAWLGRTNALAFVLPSRL